MTQIVVIEDDSTMLLNLIEVLEYEKYAPAGARSGLEGLDLIRTNSPALVLCDVMLPDIDGFQVVRALRANPATAHIPVIFISARAGRANAEQGLESGIAGYIMKPFDVGELLDTIRRVLDDSQHGAE
jgi:DNA-binding response OmpR family regulator